MFPAAQRVDRQRMIRVEWYKNMMNEKIWNVCKRNSGQSFIGNQY